MVQGIVKSLTRLQVNDQTYVGCRELAIDSILDDICDGGKLKVTLDVPSSG